MPDAVRTPGAPHPDNVHAISTPESTDAADIFNSLKTRECIIASNVIKCPYVETSFKKEQSARDHDRYTVDPYDRISGLDHPCQ